MAACEELESIILDRAAGTLSPAEAEALEAHLAGCSGCRAWADSCEEAVRLAALPEASEAERQLLTHLPARARAAFRERSRRAPLGKPLIAGVLGAAAVVAALVLAPRVAPVEPRAGMAVEDVDSSELEAWALSDPLEDQDEAVEDDSIDPGDSPELDWEQTE